MDKTRIRLREPRDLIAYVPYRLGFHPERSVVLLGLTPNAAGRGEAGLIARADLAHLAHPDAGPAVAATIADAMRRDGARDVAAVVYTNLPHPERADDLELGAALATVEAALDWVHVDPWVVGPDGWGHLDCGCCPPGGRPLAELEASAAAAALVLEGLAAAPRRADLGVFRLPDGPGRRAAARAAAAERARGRSAATASRGAPRVRGAAFGVPGARPARDQGPLRRWRREGAALWDATAATMTGRPGTSPPSPPAEALGRLLAYLADRQVRDAVVARTIAGDHRPVTAYLDTAAVVAAYDAARAPEPGVFAAAVALGTAVAETAPDGAGAPALGLLAFLAWWRSDGARADVLARQALAEEPGHHLAELVVRALDAAAPPPWYEPRQAGRAAAGARAERASGNVAGHQRTDGGP
ncbi:DUF4192 domain-containing protein [Georgenia ruanii]|uniref:DUF4192 family protein n=1 Tax=Georgenia ruanii TaxID=348442 RepID=A0A7J9UVA8_9MICO|nr:DUF4192 domain-containing protein [Georgenia ruanii]MPV88569.1 DUF4192 family protein [Georgenia ruanii]